MNFLQKLRELRRRLVEDFDRVPDMVDDLAAIGLREDDDIELILDTIDDEIAALEASEDNESDCTAETDGGKDV